jgi:hypothetical protein
LAKKLLNLKKSAPELDYFTEIQINKRTGGRKKHIFQKIRKKNFLAFKQELTRNYLNRKELGEKEEPVYICFIPF